MLLKGKDVAISIYDSIIPKIRILAEKNIIPKLQVIIIGKRPDSMMYVRMKKKKAESLGLITEIKFCDESISNGEVLELINEYNIDDKIHGILVQLPLPSHLDTNLILDSVKTSKDVDGFHTYNFGSLALNQTQYDYFSPCTAVACLEFLDYYNIDIQGKDIIVIGSSRVIGLPVSLLLINRKATVTICCSSTKNLKDKCLLADIIVSACGQAEMIKGDWIKKDAVLIDVGINCIEVEENINGEIKKKNKTVGDIDFESVKDKCFAITPVPGGIGPVTIAVLMKHLVISAQKLLV